MTEDVPHPPCWQCGADISGHISPFCSIRCRDAYWGGPPETVLELDPTSDLEER